MKKIILILIPIILVILSLIGIYNYKKITNDNIFYKMENYIYLDYKEDIFYYFYYNTEYIEEDQLLEVKHDKWKFLFYNEDLFIREKDYKEAKEYYDNDKN